ncbi:MAG TPA: hypothetical protein H9902_13685 [Candidatus Stackebrandtia faecavium]|nr:hypothetical protein [Candidatus Stackebrandtia faecavium]
MSAKSAKPPVAILAACGLLLALSVGFAVIGVYTAASDIAVAVLAFIFAGIVVILGYGVWKGRRRGSQMAVIVFAIALWAVASNMSAISVAAPMAAQAVALALALSVTVPRSARTWFSPKRP